MGVTVENWGTAPDGSPVWRVQIVRDDLTVSLLSFGATVQDIRLAGAGHSLVLGYPVLDPYLKNPNYFGASVGRYANRIANGRTILDGRALELDRNDGAHHLHGGSKGSSFRNWAISETTDTEVTFQDTLPDGHMGFPGNLRVSATFSLDEARALSISYRAETDAPTLCNFTSHNYFNLDGSGSLRHHRLQVIADRYVPVGSDGIPTGPAGSVLGSPLDLRTPTPLWAKDGPVKLDHNYCLGNERTDLQKAASLSSENSSIAVELFTTEPGLQVYTGQFIVGAHGPYSGVALEPQIWPDAPNRSEFPSAVLRPEEVSEQKNLFRFSGF